MASLFKSLSTVGGHTFLSRILGFVRDLVLARVFGADANTDAFFVAFKVPNFMRRLFGEGAFNTAFVPVLSEYKERRSYEELKLFVDHIAGTLGLVLFLVVVLGVLGAPYVASLFALGWVINGVTEPLALAGEMLRFTFPYLFFISLTAFAGGVLNAHHRFAVPAFTPVLLNLVLIGFALLVSPHLETPIMALAWGVLVAGIVQFGFQLPFLAKLKLLPNPKPGFKDEGVMRVMKLMVPALFAVSVTQINLLLDTVLATLLTTGSVSWLYYSDRLMEFPLGILGVALGTVILPSLSREHAGESPEQFNKTLDWGLKVSVILGLPAAVGIAVLAGPMIATLFLSDVFTAHDVEMARMSLIAYSFGLPAFILIKVLAPGYYARQDTKTPVRIAMIAMAANMVFNLILIWPLAHAGLALATGISAWLNAVLLLRGLVRSGIYEPYADWLKLLAKLVLGLSAMGGAIWFGSPLLADWLSGDVWWRAGQLLLWISVGAAAYFAVLVALGLRPRHLLRAGGV